MTLAEHLTVIQARLQSDLEQIQRLEQEIVRVRTDAVQCEGQIALLHLLIAAQPPPVEGDPP